ncbi:MAG TPA: DUF418 domain-containing protein [Ohtaekwangia sp.]|uniref:DUF418 domain-containing protein n=1 Tax=Ohtaekwangia sp. TaxID=2066019 RepID=UPI002F95E729
MTVSAISRNGAPVSQAERIVVLDSLRGIAILGILLMNVPLFTMPGPLGFDPLLKHETGINLYWWYIVNGFFDGTQRALFSMLFGAGIILFIGRQENRSEGLQPADYFFRRQLWLMMFSLIDVFVLLWFGDILLDYACYGMMLFTFRKLSPRQLIIAAGICLALMLVRENRDLYLDKSVISKGEAVAAIDTTVTKLTADQKDELEAMQGFKKRTSREGKLKRAEEITRKMQGDYATVYMHRTDIYINHLPDYLFLQAWDVFICFFLGMAFYKSGILTGQASVRLYALMAVVGLGIGVPLALVRLQKGMYYEFNWYEYTRHATLQYYQLERIARSLGVLGAIMLLYKSGVFNWFFKMLQPVGQMALTNYLSQSLICGVIFYGFAFGLFGKLERYQVYNVVLSIWAFQIVFCNIWMRFFLYGPAEWLWRSLTYWKPQPFRKSV